MRKKLLFYFVFVTVLLIFTGCQNSDPTPTPIPEPTHTPEPTAVPEPTVDPYVAVNAETFAANERLGRGINLGNALDGASEGAAGLYLQEQYFVDIADAGFDSIRLPVRWTSHTEVTEPYTIDERFLERVDWAIEQAFANELNVVLNAHHFEAIMQQPHNQSDRLTAIWRQLAERYQDYPDTLYFEILNEPQDNLDSEAWNQIFPGVLATIRETNPERYVIIGPDLWNGVQQLPTLELPADDRRIIATFHYYSPHQFTHQGAWWAETGTDEQDIPWGAEADVKGLTNDFDGALAWSDAEKRPLYIGEFGVYYAAPEESRIAWLTAVREAAEAREFSWSAWDFGTDFAIYNLPRRMWREPLLNALIPES